MIGETLSHFKITEKLGQGGMGVVYRGIDLDLDRPVAIKVLPPESQHDEDSVARFLREAKTASKLQHPAITTIYEFGVKDNLRYLVMEFIDGKTLKQILKNGSMAIRQLLEISIQVADALSLADEKKIIHRDIKAENIMLTDRGQVKILDFGLAKMVEKSGPIAADNFQTAGGVVMGTITHMSPEQALGAEVDARTDLYSTGVVMYEMASGQLPFSGSSASVVLAKILNQPAPSPSDFNPEIPPSLEKLIRRCLEKNREQRYQSAANLLLDLRGIKHEVEQSRDWSGTVVMAAPAKDRAPAAAPVENLRELIPATPSPAPAATPSGGAAGSGRAASGSPAPVSAPVQPAQPVPPSGATVVMPGADTTAIRRAISKGEPSRALRVVVRPVVYLLKALRRGIGWAGGAYSFSCVALFALSLLSTDQLRSLAFALPLLHRFLDPGLAVVGRFVPFPLVFQDADFLPVAVGLTVYLVQLGVTGGLEKAEGALRAAIERKPAAAGSPFLLQQQHRLVTPASASRMSLLREYAVAKRMLSEAQKEMAFLAVDVAGSTKMKLGEEKITIEHAFAEYKKFLERIFREYRVYKVAWTPDGVMTCFASADDAATAGRKIITDLDFFNRDVHQMRTKFRVRAGVNVGVILIPEDKPLEEISDHAIDVAGHLQKEAEVDTLWVSAEVHGRLMDRNGFTHLDVQVDGHEVFAWRRVV